MELSYSYLDLSYYKRQEKTLPHILLPLKTEKDEFHNNNFYNIIARLTLSEYGKAIYSTFYKEEHVDIFKSTIKQHGSFFQSFLKQHFRHSIKKDILDFKISIQTLDDLQQRFYSLNIKYRKHTETISNLIDDYLTVFIYHNNNLDIYLEVDYWMRINSAERICEICSKKYKVIDFPEWLYFGAFGHKTICFECPVRIPSSKEETLTIIRELISECEFIPNSDFSPRNYKFSSRVHANSWSKVVKAIFKLGLSPLESRESSINLYFKSWFSALVNAEVLPGNVIITKRGIKCIANSGNQCNSLDEQFIDNWMFQKGILAQKEPFYPKHIKYNPNGKRRADWIANGYYIEYFGLKGDIEYDKKTEEKIHLSKLYNLKLIEIYPENLANLELILAPLLKQKSPT